MLDKFAEALGVPQKLDEHKKTLAMRSRLYYLGHGHTCPRCGGTGNYSYHRMAGTVCFKCGGAKFLPPELTEDLLETVTTQVREGKLEPYLEDLRNKAYARSAVKRVMQAWQDTGISKKYNWRVACDPNFLEDGRISDLNAIMCDQYDIVNKLSGEYEYGKRKGDPELAREIREATEKSIQIINETAELI